MSTVSPSVLSDSALLSSAPLVSEASVPPALPVSVLSASTVSVSSALEVSVPPVRICFTTPDNILLLREVAGYDQPFAKASLAWEEVAQTSQS